MHDTCSVNGVNELDFLIQTGETKVSEGFSTKKAVKRSKTYSFSAPQCGRLSAKNDIYFGTFLHRFDRIAEILASSRQDSKDNNLKSSKCSPRKLMSLIC